VTIAVTAEHEALADSIRSFCDDHVDAEVRRSGPRAPAGLWKDLAEQRLLGLHLSEEDGGEGYGPGELAIVLEQLGRALVPGPVLPTVLASTLLAQIDTPAAREVLPGLASGAQVGAVGLSADTLALRRNGEQLELIGSVVVSGGLEADVLLLPAADGAHTRWVLLRGDEVEAEALDGFDLTRTVARVSTGTDPLHVPAHRLIEGLHPELVADVAAGLAAAEAAGIADWCLQTATEYASTRHQFGRPIGQFQGTKHRCANMLVEVERVRAVAWDAARAIDDAGERELAATAAAVIGLEAAVRCAEDAIQVLGGIGYTWEHDAHLYLRRAVSLRALLGGDLDDWRMRAATAALDGRRRELRLDLGEDELRSQIRAEVEAAAALEGPARREYLADHGLIAPHWPEPYGRAADAREQLVIDEELARAGVTRPVLAIGSWAAPTILAHGTEDQQQRFVHPTLTGEIFWCQLFSEPEAGSDLAALTTRAERVEGGWRLHGQKVWTSLAQMANWGICLARTEPDAPKHQGITYFLVDMASDGLEIRPLREITGEEIFNEVFLDGVFVPDENVVGEVGDGWRLARTTLANERVGLSDTSTWGSDVRGVLEQIRETAKGDGAPAARLGAPARARLGQLVLDGQTLRLLGFRITLRALTGTDPGPTSNVRKLESMRHSQDVAEAGLRVLAERAVIAADDGARWGREYLAARAYSIGGGTTEVLRNVIAERLLGLPRDP
jgi:3-oxochol-4-en-24-oyl-CoA dehydrogenase